MGVRGVRARGAGRVCCFFRASVFSFFVRRRCPLVFCSFFPVACLLLAPFAHTQQCTRTLSVVACLFVRQHTRTRVDSRTPAHRSACPSRFLPPPSPTQTMSAPPAALEAAVLASVAAVEAAVDAKLAALDNMDDADLASVRARRVAEMKRDAEARATWLAAGRGRVTSVRGDADFFDAARGVERVVALFWRRSRPCEAMQALVRALAPRHVETKFIEVEAETVPFLADKLKVWMLPTLAFMVDGKSVDAVIGFDGLPGGDRRHRVRPGGSPRGGGRVPGERAGGARRRGGRHTAADGARGQGRRQRRRLGL